MDTLKTKFSREQERATKTMEHEVAEAEQTLIADRSKLNKYSLYKMRINRRDSILGYGLLLTILCLSPFYAKWQVGLLYTQVRDPYKQTADRLQREKNGESTTPTSAGTGSSSSSSTVPSAVPSWLLSNRGEKKDS